MQYLSHWNWCRDRSGWPHRCRQAGEKMSKHSVSAGDIAALLAALFRSSGGKRARGTGKSFPIVVIQESGLDGFWIHRVLLSEGIESHVVDAASIATSLAGGVGPRPTGSTARLCFARCLPTNAVNRGSAQWFGLPTPEDEDLPPDLPRAWGADCMERVQHVNRIKGLLFSQGASGYEPLRRDRRARLDALQTGDGRRLPQHLKAQVCRELDRLELLLEQIKAVEAERDAPLDAEQTKASAPAADVAGWSMALGRSSLRSFGLKDSPGQFDNRRQVAAYAGLAPTPWQSGLRSIASRASRNRATRDYGQR